MKTDQAWLTMSGLMLAVLICWTPLIGQNISWKPATVPSGGAVTSLLMDGEGNLFAGTWGGVYRSTDYGDTWAKCASFPLWGGTFSIDSSGAILAGGTGLWRSTDAGTSWNRWVSVDELISSVAVASDGTIYVGFTGGPMAPHGVFRVVSEHSWLRWLSQESTTTFNLEGVYFIDANTGTVVGGLGTILHTTDGGVTWTSQTSGTTETLRDVWFMNGTTGIAVGDMGTILRTSDGGTSWTGQTSGTSENLYGLSFADAVHGTVVGAGGTILCTTDGGDTWASQISGTTATLHAVSFPDPSTGTAVGVDAQYPPHGRILRTTDGGATWNDQTWVSAPPLFGVCFIDAETGTAVGSGTEIFRTNDGGTSWTSQQSGEAWQLNDVSFTDVNTGAAVGGGGVVLLTTDGGEHWVRQSTETTAELYGISLVDANTCMAVGDQGTILRSSQDSSSGTATLVSHGLSGKRVNSLLFSAKHGLLAIADWSSLYRGSTTDTSWVTIGSTPAAPKSFVEDAAGNLFLGADWGQGGGLYLSTDGGMSWSSTGLREAPAVSSLAFGPSGQVFAGLNGPPFFDLGVYHSTDGGLTWSNLGFKDYPINAILTADESRIFLGSGRGIFRSSDGGTSWEVACEGMVDGHPMSLLAVDPITLLVGMNFGLFRSSDGGESWQESGEGIYPHYILSLAADSSGNLYAGNALWDPKEGGIFKSTDRGFTWRCITPDSLVGVYEEIPAIAVTQMNTLLASVSLPEWWIVRSVDGGENWMRVERIGDAHYPRNFALDRNGNIYGATGQWGVLRSTDDGLTWMYANEGLSNPRIHCVLARGSGEAFAGGEGGVFRSTDAGNSWVYIGEALGSTGVRAMAFDLGGDLVVSTYQGDIFRTTDLGITWTKDMMSARAASNPVFSMTGDLLFAADSTGIYRCTRSTTSVRHVGGFLPGAARLEQNYPNPFNPSTTICYALPARSHVTLTVFNTLGQQVVALIQGEQEAGFHEVQFEASGLASGVYLYRLQAGDFVQTKKLVLVK